MARKGKSGEVGPFTHVGAAAALKGRWGEGAKGKERVKADWGNVDPVSLHTLVSSVGELGGAVTLGVDKNGTGFTVAVWLGGEKVFNQWYSGEAGGVEILHQDIEGFALDARALARDN